MVIFRRYLKILPLLCEQFEFNCMYIVDKLNAECS